MIIAVDEKGSPVSTILVMDDMAADRNALAETLEKGRFEVLLAPNGELYLGSRTNGLVRFDGKRFEAFDKDVVFGKKRAGELSPASRLLAGSI